MLQQRHVIRQIRMKILNSSTNGFFVSAISNIDIFFVVSFDDNFILLTNFLWSEFINPQRTGYRKWIIDSVDWNGKINSWSSWTIKVTNEAYASMIGSFKAVLICKYLCIFSTSFLKFCCRRNLRKYSFQFFQCSKLRRATYFILTQRVSTCFFMQSTVIVVMMANEP